MLLLLVISLILIFSFILLRNVGAKKQFNVPWYYITLSLDIGGAKGRLYSYKGINGIPDAVFKHCLLPRYIVGELKGRKFGRAGMRKYEFGQLMLYIGILKKRYFFSSVKGRLSYKDKVLNVDYDKKIFSEIINMKPDALKIINRFQ